MKRFFTKPDSALVIAAHPDDAEFQCGATLAKWAASGTTVHYLICTDGSKGTWDPAVDQKALVVARQKEQIAAARRLGATGSVLFLEQIDGELQSDLATRSQVAKAIRQLRPDAVLGHDPWRRYRLHPDHRHAGLLAIEGIVAARDPFFFPSMLSSPTGHRLHCFLKRRNPIMRRMLRAGLQQSQQHFWNIGPSSLLLTVFRTLITASK